ncbi:type 12 methyltransferase [Paenibacillus polymyxa]|nr:type 12 methyltransferase [Paenibacillus polymyxa]
MWYRIDNHSLIKIGIHITGTDISSSMLEYARVKAQGLPVDFIEAGARTFDPKSVFP